MKAVIVREFGGTDVLRYEELPDPAPGVGEVLLRVRAVGVNFADTMVRAFGYFETKLPVVLGLEGAGVVEAVGPGVEQLKPGDRVAGMFRSSYAELATASASRLFRLPAELSFEQGAAIPIGYMTAWYALFNKAQLQPGERVLVHAAGGAVGTAAVQLAKHFGGWVAATAGSERKLELARGLGADVAINYETEDFVAKVRELTGGKGVDIVLEATGGKTFAGSLKSLAVEGRMGLFGAASGNATQLNILDLSSKQISVFGVSLGRSPKAPRALAEMAERTMPLFVDGRLKPVIYQALPFDQAAEAHRLIESRAPVGKVVLTV